MEEELEGILGSSETVSCLSNIDCPAGTVCYDGQCVPITINNNSYTYTISYDPIYYQPIFGSEPIDKRVGLMSDEDIKLLDDLNKE